MKFELSTLDDYSDEAILSELCRVADGLKGQRLTRERFNARARVHSSTLSHRFGSWSAALQLAGISEAIAPRHRVLTKQQIIDAISAYAAENPAQPVAQTIIASRLEIDPGSISRRFGKWKSLLSEVGLAPVPLGRRYSEEECFENILSLWTHYGRQPHFSELNCPPSNVGSKAYVGRWGGWRAALGAFVKRVNEEVPTSTNSIPEEVQSEPDLTASSTAPTSRSISLTLRYRVLNRDKFRCLTCGASPAKDVGVELHVDHIIPWSRGGKNEEENLQTLCSICNLGKRARMPDSNPRA